MKAVLITLVLCAFLGGLKVTYQTGDTAGQAKCEARQSKANEKAEAVQKVDTQAVINRATATSTQQERGRVAINQVFNHIAKEQDHAPANPVDSCVLPAERLRSWADANAGRTDQGATSGQPDRAAPALAAPGLRADAGPGSQPPRDSAGLPPAGPADVQPAGLSGDQP